MQNELVNKSIDSSPTQPTTGNSKRRSLLRTYVEYTLALVVYRGIGILPRSLALAAGRLLGEAARLALPRLRRNAEINLKLAYPTLDAASRKAIQRGTFRSLGRLLGESSQFPKLNRANIESVVAYDGLENFQRALAAKRGVILLTGHIGSWELSVFAHSIYGYPMSFLARRIDNPLVEALALSVRTRFGNRCIDKKGSLREIVRTLKTGGVVGILSDLNTTREEGVFVDFFGIPACTTAGVATLAMRTGAIVLPGYIIWDDEARIHRLRFEPPLETINTGNQKLDVVANTEVYTNVLENVIRRCPDQWLWIHRRWRTRPEGGPEIY